MLDMFTVCVVRRQTSSGLVKDISIDRNFVAIAEGRRLSNVRC